ncbi:PHP domain-containing protein [Lacticaseibacillus daqingensis]|uniref:PHP domain-containing protein n=1 Tax=Lacticaseibacillus daqingensis TaxID=2486014 RepID=UPI000F77B6DB|nr:PHP domain-containing protein [Lacticaseibacillus daqingensis]
MTYYDQHVHTYFSFDSQAQFEAYLAQTTHPFVTTEHLEMANPDDGGRDDAPDYAAYVAKLAALRQQVPNQLLRGIEVGYYAPKQAALSAYLAAGDYDLVLLSFHHDGQYDYQDKHFLTVPLRAHVEAYYDRMLAGLTAFDGADVLAHFDYGLRVLTVTPTQLIDWVGPTLKRILQTVIAKDMALEFNAKSAYQWDNLALYERVLPWYVQLGGTKVTLGSDAHTADKFETHFEDAKTILRAAGVTHLTTYRAHHAELEAL